MVQQKLSEIPFLFIAVFSLMFTACDSGTDINDGTEGTGTLEVLLHDAPADYEEVNVFVERVEVNNAEDDTGWVEVGAPEETFDLLELTNGAVEVIGSRELEPGKYNQIRLILNNEENSIVVDGQQHDLFVPSGEQTGVKLNINAEIKDGITYTILLDFDASRSIVERGNEQSGIDYLLKPVVHATNKAASGNVAGKVEPVGSESFIYAIADSDTLSSTKVDSTDGSFQLIGLEEGTYSISVDPNDSYQKKDTTGVEVSIGETTELGTIELTEAD